MITALTPTETEVPSQLGDSGSDDENFVPTGDDGSRGSPGRSSDRSYWLGMWFALAAILMLFTAFTSAYIVRQGFSNDWKPIRMPPLLWLNTAVLLGSSLTMEAARRALKRAQVAMFNRWVSITALLGWGFLVGQVVAWNQLAQSGIYLSTNPHSSFFFVLTGTHGVHLIGGVLALMVIALRAWRDFGVPGFRAPAAASPAYDAAAVAGRELGVDLTALYWHFMDGLWVYLMILLFVLR